MCGGCIAMACRGVLCSGVVLRTRTSQRADHERPSIHHMPDWDQLCLYLYYCHVTPCVARLEAASRGPLWRPEAALAGKSGMSCESERAPPWRALRRRQRLRLGDKGGTALVCRIKRPPGVSLPCCLGPGATELRGASELDSCLPTTTPLAGNGTATHQRAREGRTERHPRPHMI